jgi:hypothetical protein
LIDLGVDTTFLSVMAKPYVMPVWIDSHVRSLFN